MKKFLMSFAAIFAVISLAMFATSCNGDPDNGGGPDNGNGGEPEKVTVTFDAGEGAFLDGTNTIVRTIDKGQKASAPIDDPELANYTFKGWFTQANGQGTAYVADNVYNADTTYHAFWDITVKIPVKFGATTVNAGLVAVGSGTEIDTVELDGNVIGYEVKRIEAGHASSYAWFGPVDFTGKKLTDYEAIEFSFQATADCPTSSRRPHLVASEDSAFTGITFETATVGAVTRNWQTTPLQNTVNGTAQNSAGDRFAKSEASDIKLVFDMAAAQSYDSANSLYFAIYEHNGIGSAHKITGITFIERPVSSDEETVAAVKVTIEGITQAQLTVAQVVLNTEAEAKAFVEDLGGTLFLDGVTVEVEAVSFKAAVAGEKDGDIMGENGEYVFKLNLSKGIASDSVSKTLIISATPGLEDGDVVWSLVEWIDWLETVDETGAVDAKPATLNNTGNYVNIIMNTVSGNRESNTAVDVNYRSGENDPFLVAWFLSTGGGLNILTGSASPLIESQQLGLDFNNIVYELVVQGEVIGFAPQNSAANSHSRPIIEGSNPLLSGDPLMTVAATATAENPRLSINDSGSPRIMSETLVQNEAFEIKTDIPSSLSANNGRIRIRPEDANTGAIVKITNIEIIFRGIR